MTNDPRAAIRRQRRLIRLHRRALRAWQCYDDCYPYTVRMIYLDRRLYSALGFYHDWQN